MEPKKTRASLGGVLRLALLTACATAFLLVPAALASAAINSHVMIEGSGSGEVIPIEGFESLAGNPEINCHKPSQVGDVCDTEAVGEGLKGIAVTQKAAPGSEFVEWIVVKGLTPFAPCNPSECSPFLQEGEIIIKAIFAKEPNVHIEFEGSGSGTVRGVPGETEGSPPVNCHWNGATEERTDVPPGACDVENGLAFGFFEAITVEAEADEGSEFVEWAIVEEKGTNIGGCEPGVPHPELEECGLTTEGGEIVLKAVFAALPTFPLNRSTSGSGAGSFKCDTGSGAEACHAEYLAGTNVTVTTEAATGSEFIEFTGDCSGSSCELTMDEEHSVGAVFNLIAEPFAVNQTGEGSVECEDATAGGGFAACATSYPYGHTIKVAATPVGENVIGSLTGEGSAAGNCSFEATNGSCEFAITEDSGVNAAFAAGNTIETQKENVHGEVPQTTELATTCENDVDLGEFIPGKAENYTKTCGLTVTSTGSEASLTAADETGNDTGYLTQKPTHLYSLPQALEARATGIPSLEYPGEGGGVFAPLTTPVTLLTYGGPVSADNVTLTFRQKIGLHDALHTGTYSKTITLTLQQTP